MQNGFTDILDLFRDMNLPVETKMWDKKTAEALVTFRKEMEIWLEDKDAEIMDKYQEMLKQNEQLKKDLEDKKKENANYLEQLDEYSQLYNKTMNQIESLKETIVKQAEMMVEMRYGK